MARRDGQARAASGETVTGTKQVLLVDVDSIIPNLALMHYSAYWKNRLAEVSLIRMGGRFRGVPLGLYEDIDKAYVSCVFCWNRELGELVVNFLRRRGIDTEYGGTGFDWGLAPGLWSRIADGIERHLPDYDLYGDNRAIGFCQRGCDRKCHFCVVWRKEGTIGANAYSPPADWVPADKTKALLLDNDLALYDYERQAEIIQWFRDAGVRYSLTQGYDIRCVAEDDRLAPLVAETMPYDLKFHNRRLYTAWDYIGIEPFVRKGLERLIAAGVNPNDICVYMICGAPNPVTGADRPRDIDHSEALHRFQVIREYGAYPYVMPYNRRRDDPWLNEFARYVNRAVFKSCAWEEYDRLEHERQTRSKTYSKR